MPSNQTSGVRFWSRAAALFICSFVLIVSSAAAAPQTGAPRGPGKRVGVRLRSFVPQAAGSMYFEPTATGGLVRLTALGLPRAGALMPGAGAFLVWALSKGEQPLRVAELRLDGGGNGGIEFARPPSFERYSIVVTAELNATASHPNGVMVFASYAGAVKAFYGEKEPARLTGSQRKALDKELRRRGTAAESSSDFYSEVDGALNSSPGGGRVIELVGGEVAPKAHGVARVASRGENIYVRTLVKQLPPPAQIGANTYVLWGVVPGGRITYMGSFPADDVRGADTYVRVAGIDANEVDLLLSAENRRPAASPSGRRALVSSNAEAKETGPAFGAIEGRVLGADGEPLPGAVVEVRPYADTVMSGDLPVTYTDEQGRFFLEGLRPGEHVIYASKEDDGYPSTYQAFFISDASALPRVNVENRQVSGEITVRLGPKGARLKARVLDASTGEPIEQAEVTLYRDENADTFLSFGLNEEGGFNRLVPASIPLRMKIVAPGYGEWFYGADGSKEKAQPLTLASDETKEFTVSLRPLE